MKSSVYNILFFIVQHIFTYFICYYFYCNKLKFKKIIIKKSKYFWVSPLFKMICAKFYYNLPSIKI